MNKIFKLSTRGISLVIALYVNVLVPKVETMALEQLLNILNSRTTALVRKLINVMSFYLTFGLNEVSYASTNTFFV